MIDWNRKNFSVRNTALVFGLILFIGLLMIIPSLIRTIHNNDSLIGEQSYFHLGLAQNIGLDEEHQYPLNNNYTSIFHYLLMGFITFLGPFVASKLVPFILGLIAVVLLLVMSKEKIFQKNEQIIFIGLCVISPIFLSIFSTLTPFSLVLILGLAGFLLFVRESRFAYPMIILIAFVDIIGFVILCLLLLAYSVLHKRSEEVIFTFISGGVIAIIMSSFGFLAIDPFFGKPSLSTFFSGLGGNFGYSIFLMILALIGIGSQWKKSNRVIISGSILLLVFVLSWALPVARVLFLPIIGILATKGLTSLLRRRWAVEKLRRLTLFMIALSLLFTILLTITDLTRSEPLPKSIEAYKFLQTIPDSEVVLSSPDNGIFIERIGRRKAFVDQANGIHEFEFQDDLNTLWYSHNLKEISRILHEHNITHILVDKDMVNGKIWSNQDQGLLFFLENDKRFVPIFSSDYATIYRFIHE